MPEPLLVLDSGLKVILASHSFYGIFKVKPEDTVGRLIYDLGNKQWDIPRLRELLETILPEKTTFDNYEVEHDFTTIGKRIMLLNARQIEQGLGKERNILLAIEDITERKKADDGVYIARQGMTENLKAATGDSADDSLAYLQAHEVPILVCTPCANSRFIKEEDLADSCRMATAAELINIACDAATISL